MKPDATSGERFDGWFAKSIAKLAELPEGDGGFAALMIALPLYERYIVGKLIVENKATDEEDKKREIAIDLNLTAHQRSIFWDMFRNGFMHQGMPKTGPTKWWISHSFSEMPVFRTIDGVNIICIDPWKFADRVIHLFKDDPRLMTASNSYPLGEVFRYP